MMFEPFGWIAVNFAIWRQCVTVGRTLTWEEDQSLFQ